ncbi:site-specific integrase [Thiomonas sp. FB-Cd]|uniref:tyrosine-type recombinase/integrase n=1 Tax=Thiomonas sp. FB-Cd TaxID=1158292 RepID=UPI0004DFC8A9|nr:site-specific integrase [Thiomonas sp. FB-Cd]
MASIEKRENEQGTTYRVKVRLKGKPAQTATFERLTDARRWAQQTEAAIREGRHFAGTEARRTTLADVIDRFKREKLPSMNGKADRLRYLDFWSQSLGAYTLADVTPARINEAMHTLASTPSERTHKPRSAATLGQYRQALSRVLALCEREWELIEVSPMKRVSKPKLPGGRVRYLSDTEREALLAACKESNSADLYPAVILALTTGARQAEIMSATWAQVDLQRRVLILQKTKNGERRALPLAAPAIAVLQARVRRIDTDLIFPAKNPKNPIDLRTPWETALQRAGITDFHWHDLRHTAASYLAMSGASLAEIAEILGHKTLAMVKRYSHLSHDHVASVAERMAAKYFQG